MTEDDHWFRWRYKRKIWLLRGESTYFTFSRVPPQPAPFGTHLECTSNTPWSALLIKRKGWAADHASDRYHKWLDR